MKSLVRTYRRPIREREREQDREISAEKKTDNANKRPTSYKTSSAVGQSEFVSAAALN